MARVDFNETFVPMAKFITITCILALGSALNWEIHQMDVKILFFSVILEVESYMVQLEGFVQEGKEDLVYKFKKILYGLK